MSEVCAFSLCSQNLWCWAYFKGLVIRENCQTARGGCGEREYDLERYAKTKYVLTFGHELFDEVHDGRAKGMIPYEYQTARAMRCTSSISRFSIDAHPHWEGFQKSDNYRCEEEECEREWVGRLRLRKYPNLFSLTSPAEGGRNVTLRSPETHSVSLLPHIIHSHTLEYSLAWWRTTKQENGASRVCIAFEMYHSRSTCLNFAA